MHIDRRKEANPFFFSVSTRAGLKIGVFAVLTNIFGIYSA